MSRSNLVYEGDLVAQDEDWIEEMNVDSEENLRKIKRDIKASQDITSQPSNPALTFNPSGYRRNVDEKELGADLAAIAEMGYEIPVPRPVVITEEVSMRSVLALCDALVAHALYKFPNLFLRDPTTTAVEITPIELKAYFFLLFLNRMRAVNQITGDAVGTIPYLSDDAPMPRALFECLCACAPFEEGNMQGILTMDYKTDMGISNENIIGETWLPNDLSTPALISLQSPPVARHGIHILEKDAATGEAVVLEMSGIMTTLSQFWTDDVDEDRIVFAVRQIYERTFPYSSLPATAISADFFACSRALDAAGRPANQLMCPFSNYDAMHATIFAYFKRCHIQTTMNQKVRMQAPTRPNDTTSAAQYSPDYCIGVYVSQGDRLKNDLPTYLGSRKYYSYDGKSVNPAPMYKKIDPEIISFQALDCARALISQLAIAMKALDGDNTVSVPQEVSSPQFYRSIALAFTAAIFKRVQGESLGFMTRPSYTAMPNQALDTQLFGSIAMIAKGLGPIVVGSNLVLPFFEFANDTLVEGWFNMNRLQALNLANISKLFGSTISWNDLSAEDDVYLLEFDGHVVDQTWVDTYMLLPGWRKFPFFSVVVPRVYEGFLEAYSVAGGMFIPVPVPDLGDSTMLTYTKFVRDTTITTKLPVFDVVASPNQTPWPLQYSLQIERLMFSDFIFGLNFSQTVVSVASLDVFSDDAEELNEFPYANPLNILPNARTPYSTFNDDVANSNGVIQKAFSANVSKNHSTPLYIMGSPVLPKTDTTHCFWSAVSSALGSIGDAVLTGVNTFIDTGNPVAGVLDAGKMIAEDIFTTGSMHFSGSPHLTVSAVEKQRQKPGLYQHAKRAKTSSKAVVAKKDAKKTPVKKGKKKPEAKVKAAPKPKGKPGAKTKPAAPKPLPPKPKNPKPKKPPTPPTKTTGRVRTLSTSGRKTVSATKVAKSS